MNSDARIAFLEAELVKYKAKCCGVAELYFMERGMPPYQAEEAALNMIEQAAGVSKQLETYIVTAEIQ